MYKNKEKDKAWKNFSLFIRTRDCLKTTGTYEYGHCYTCGRYINIKDGHAGHYHDGRSNADLFDEKRVRLQCYFCNVVMKENKMVKEVFKDTLEKEGIDTLKVSEPIKLDYAELADKYNLKLKELKWGLKNTVED